MSNTDVTITTNQNVLARIREQLSQSGNLIVYKDAADKLVGWLNDRRAYYDQARPMIVDIIEVAQRTIRRMCSWPDNVPFYVSRCPAELRPYIDCYLNLVHTVVKFVELFTEPQLKARIQAVVDTVAPPIPSHTAPSATVPSIPPPSSATPNRQMSGSPSTPLEPPLKPKPQKKRRISKRDSFIMLDVEYWKKKEQEKQSQDRSAETSKESAPVPDGGGVTETKEGTEAARISGARTGLISNEVLNVKSSTLPVVSQDSERSSLTVKAEQIDAVMAEATSSPRQETMDSTPGAGTSTTGVASPRVASRPLLSPTTIDDSHVSRAINEPNANEPNITEPEVQQPRVDNLPENISVPVGDGNLAGGTDIDMNEAPAPPEAAPTVQVDSEAGPHTALGEVQFPEDMPSQWPTVPSISVAPDPSNSHNVDISASSEMAMVVDSPEGVQVDQTIVAVTSGDDTTKRNGSGTIMTIVDIPMPDSAATAASITLDRGEGEYNPDEEMQQEAIPEEGEIQPSREDTIVPGSCVSAQPSVEHPVITEDIATDTTPGSDTVVTRTKQNIILGLIAGSQKAHMHTLEFDLTQEHLDLMLRWNGRYNIPDDVAYDLCLSLAAYSLPDSVAKLRQYPEDSHESILNGAPIPWPTGRRLQARINDQAWAGLYPPFVQTRDHLVDYSAGAKLGKNTFELYHGIGFESFVFVLRLHSPSDAQLAELQERRDRDANWKEFLTSMAHFDIPNFELPDFPNLKPS